MVARLLHQLGRVGRAADAGLVPALRAAGLRTGCLPLGRCASTLDIASVSPSTSGRLHYLAAVRENQVLSSRGLAAVARADSAKSTTSSRKLKPMPDPERPKRPLAPWMRFLQDYRAKRADLKGSPKTVLTEASTQWKALPAPEKQKWEQPYEAERKAYAAAFKTYVESGKKAAWESPPGKPKAPLTPFLQFSQEYRSKNKDLKMTEATKTAASIWKSMSPQQKAPYEQRYSEEKTKHSKDMEAYKASGKEEAWKAKVGIAAKEAETTKKKEAAALKKKAAAMKKKVAALKRKEAAAKKKVLAAKKKEAAKKVAAAVAAKKKLAMAKKKDAAAKKKLAAAQKKKLALAKKKDSAERKKLAAAKKKLAAETKKLGAAKKKVAAAAKKSVKATGKSGTPTKTEMAKS